jgi:hypothetical protein
MKKLYFILIFLVLNGCEKSDDGTVEVIPLPPTELKATVVSKDQIDLTWKDNSTNETGYKIERKTDSGNFTEIGSTATDVSIFSDKSVFGTNNILSQNTNYTYRVYSFNQVGKSITYSNEVTIKTINVPTVTTYSITEVSENGAKFRGTVTSDGGSAITSRGFVWDTKSNPIITLSTKTTEGTGTGVFQSLISGLTLNTKYYVRAYATNLAGTSYGEELSFTTLSFSTVIGANGRIWMDRNLGASRVATSSNDAAAYGDLYQWGRGADGHQLINSGTTNTLSNTDKSVNSLFIVTSSDPYDWRVPQNNNLWQGGNGINNPCPTGFRIATYEEWETERKSWSSNNLLGAYSSPLKLTATNNRSSTSGALVTTVTGGGYWSSTTQTSSYRSTSTILTIYPGNAGFSNGSRAGGASCRCIKD